MPPSRDSPNVKPDYELGILIVHGIGHQRPSESRDVLTQSLIQTYQRLLIPVGKEDIDPAMSEVTIGREQKPVLIAETVWSDTVQELRVSGANGVIRRLSFLLSILPWLLLGAVGPRGHETWFTDAEATVNPSVGSTVLTRAGLRSATAQSVRGAGAVLPSLWRLAPAVGVVAAAAIGFTHRPDVTGGIIAAVLLFVVLYASSRKNLIEHVRLAATGTAGADAFGKKVSADLISMQQRCEQVWVVGHSQGGFLSHRVLSTGMENNPRVTKFLGVGSGLRPITIAQYAMSSWRVQVYGWLALLVTVPMGLGAAEALSPGGILRQPIEEFVVALIPALAAAPLTLDVAGVLAEIGRHSETITWGGLVWTIVGAACLIALVVTRNRLIRSELEPIRDLPATVDWQEVTSPSDIVGSMAIPPLPRENTRTLPSARHPIFDHGLGRYFGPHSALSYSLAGEVADQQEASTAEARTRAESVTRLLTLLGRSCYILRGGLFASALVLGALLCFWFGSPMTTLVMVSLGACAFVTVAGWIWTWGTWRDRAERIVTGTDRSRAELAARLQRRSRTPIWVFVTLIAGTVTTAATAVGTALAAALAHVEGFISSTTNTELHGSAVQLLGAMVAAALALVTLLARTRGTSRWLGVAWLLIGMSGAGIARALPQLPAEIRPGQVMTALLLLTWSVVLIRLVILRAAEARDVRAVRADAVPPSP